MFHNILTEFTVSKDSVYVPAHLDDNSCAQMISSSSLYSSLTIIFESRQKIAENAKTM